jgi:hypothetical protein
MTTSIHQSKKDQHFSSRIFAGRSAIKNSQPFDEPAISRPIPDARIFQAIFGRIFLTIRDGTMSSLAVVQRADTLRSEEILKPFGKE